MKWRLIKYLFVNTILSKMPPKKSLEQDLYILYKRDYWDESDFKQEIIIITSCIENIFNKNLYDNLHEKQIKYLGDFFNDPMNDFGNDEERALLLEGCPEICYEIVKFTLDKQMNEEEEDIVFSGTLRNFKLKIANNEEPIV